MKKLLVVVFSMALLASLNMAFANEEGDNEEDNNVQSNSEQVEKARESRKQEFEQRREMLKQKMEKDRETLKDQRESNKQNFEKARELWKEQREDELEKFKQEKDELRLKFKEKFTEERCAKIQERVRSKSADFDEREKKHENVYTNLMNRVNKFIARADEKSIDTTAIKSHLAELQTKIDKFKQDYAAYVAKLGESKNLTCGHSEGEFKGALLDTRALLKTVHADAAEIRTYVRTTILADIKALKVQMPKVEDAEDADETKPETESENETN